MRIIGRIRLVKISAEITNKMCASSGRLNLPGQDIFIQTTWKIASLLAYLAIILFVLRTAHGVAKYCVIVVNFFRIVHI